MLFYFLANFYVDFQTNRHPSVFERLPEKGPLVGKGSPTNKEILLFHKLERSFRVSRIALCLLVAHGHYIYLKSFLNLLVALGIAQIPRDLRFAVFSSQESERSRALQR